MVSDFGPLTIELVVNFSLFFFSPWPNVGQGFLYYCVGLGRMRVWRDDRSPMGEVILACGRHPEMHGTTLYDAIPSFPGRDVTRDALVQILARHVEVLLVLT